MNMIPTTVQNDISNVKRYYLDLLAVMGVDVVTMTYTKNLC